MKKAGKKRNSAQESFQEILKKHLREENVVYFVREFNGVSENITGIIRRVNRMYVLVQVLESFRPDGFLVMPVSSIDGIRHGSAEHTYKKIVSGENSLVGTKVPAVNLRNWQTIFRELRQHKFHVIVENEDKDDDNFYIGEIARIGNASVSIHHYDATGKFLARPVNMRLENITCLRFGDHYSTTFRKYIRTGKDH